MYLPSDRRVCQRCLLWVCMLLAALPAMAQKRKMVERSTDVLSVLPSATGLVKAFVEHDRRGMVQFALSTGTTLAVNYGLELAVRKDRPDGSGHHAMPSTHTAVAFDGASFLMRRYGWKWGVPAYVVSSYVAWGRVYSQRHDWWDVLGGAAIGAGAAMIFTRPFVRNADVSVAPTSFGEYGGGLTARITF